MEEALIERCHRALIHARYSHPSRLGYELLLHPAQRSAVAAYEEETGFLPGSFATLIGAKRMIFTYGAGDCFALFCRTHWHRLDPVTGAAPPDGAQDDGTITA